MKIIFVPEAKNEFFDAIDYYEDARSGLGERFKKEIDRCILWAADHPGLYRLRQAGYRRINLRIFPYYVSFITREDAFWILAIAHNSRNPEYWIGRKYMG
jgi:plasmid stabilization system protein ParE